MTLSRRDLLRVGGVGLCGWLAGCVGGEQRHASLGVSIRSSFDSNPPVTLPVTVDAYVSHVTRDVALRGVELVLCDDDRTPVASRRLGDFSWRKAPPAQQEVDESDSLFESTWYSATWSLERTVDVDQVPEWITFAVDQVWFGEDDEDGDPQIVGEARASQPIPAFEATIRRFDGERPPPPSVTAEDYRFETITSVDGDHEDALLLPDPTPTPSSSPTAGDGSVTNGSGTELPPNETATNANETNDTTADVAPGNGTRTGDATADGDV